MIVTFVLFLAGFPLLLFGAEWLVKGASRLAVAWGISALAVGLTVVAYGTSMPELAVSAVASWRAADPNASTGPRAEAEETSDDIAVGNVVGSNIANFLLVLGLSALAAPLVVTKEVVQRSLPLVIFLSFLFFAFAWDWSGDGRAIIARWQGLVFVVGLFVYTFRAIHRGRAQKRAEREQAEEIEEEFGHLGSGKFAWAIELARIVAGLVMLVVGAKWLVDGAVAAAVWLHVSKLVISLTVVAVGTSLPEIVTCVVAVLRGHRDLAVGNAVGSNVFNILMVIGVCSSIAPGGGIEVAPRALYYDIPIMIGVAVLVWPVAYTGFKITRLEGALLLGLYVVYTVYLVVREIEGSPLLAPLETAMLYGAAPLLTVTFGVRTAKQWLNRPEASAARASAAEGRKGD
ncbi:MAG: calcium/sodium antiporter [Planctomycetales bacterium]|nr:calcium/sodium antiporter [Planctomycetales bacterium]